MKRSLSLLALLAFVLPMALFAVGGADTQLPAKFPKYVFLFIGDGMSMVQISSTEIYANAVASKDISVKKLGFTQFPINGLTTTYEAGSFITDSASAGTAIATGNKTLSGVINYDPTKTKQFVPFTEAAKAAGYKIGIVSSVSLNHATPASFYAKATSRSQYYEIGVQLANSNFDYYGGGGFLEPTGKKKDQADVVELAKKNGFTYVNSKKDFDALKKGAGKVLAVNASLEDEASLPYKLDRAEGDLNLADYTRKGIELLDNDKGFFMMVESGKIDWACHANDAGAAIGEVITLDAAVAEAVKFQEKHPDETLIIVTGDHETGGMTIGFAGTQYSTFFDKVSLQKSSFVAFNDKYLKPYKEATKGKLGKVEDLAAGIEACFGLKLADLNPVERNQIDKAFARSMGGDVELTKESDYLLYGGYEPLTVKLTQILNQRAGLGWTTYSHTGVPVATFAKGAGQELFAGYYDNTDINRKLVKLLKLQTPVALR